MQVRRSDGAVIIARPASIAGHVTHHTAGSAGRYRLRTAPPPSIPSVSLGQAAQIASAASPNIPHDPSHHLDASLDARDDVMKMLKADFQMLS